MTEMYLAPIDGREADIFGSGIDCISGRAITAHAALSVRLIGIDPAM